MRQGGIQQRSILSDHGVGDRHASRLCAPFHCSAGRAFAFRADLDRYAPVDFQIMAVGIAEFDRKLHAGATAAFEMDRHVVAAQMVAGARNTSSGAYPTSNAHV